MSEKNTTEQTSVLEQQKDKVGDIIRKERVTRRITVETIAKDLKLNAKYIKELESNEYDSLPADPYVRVYLRSLAKYLSLNPEEILKKFYDERGLGSEHYKKESVAKIKVSMKEKEESRSPLLVTALILIAVLIGFSFFASKKGWINTSSGKILTVPNKTATSTSTPVPTNNDSLIDDSLFSGAPVQVADSAEMNEAGIDPQTATVDTIQQLRLMLEVTGDSVWVQVFSDGKSWKNVVYKNQSREFTAQDSFNIHVGNNSLVKCSLNGKQLKINGIGVVAFKCDKSLKPSVWTLSRWNSIFKDRL
ncbi:MAG TPA: RodZ domain-containing protein [Chitinispirillaceae bacterium]|nr:RodZ domain-containing protein [Chitinispirillaceae bacterium]